MIVPDGSTNVIAATVLCSLFQQRYVRSRRFDTVSGKGYRPRLIRLRWPMRILPDADAFRRTCCYQVARFQREGLGQI